MKALNVLLQQLTKTPTAVVFTNHTTIIRAQQFIDDIQTMAVQISQSSAQRFALTHQNSYQFSVALFAVLISHKTPVLLPNNQPGTLQQFNHSFDAVLSDQETNITDVNKLPNTKIALAIDEQQAIIFYTSGTTGTPTQVIRNIKQLTAEIDTFEKAFGAEVNATTFYTTVSHQHVYGLTFYLLWPLAAQRPIHLQQLQFPEDVIQLLQAEIKATLITSPALLKRLSSTQSSISIANVITAGSLLEADTAKHLADYYQLFAHEILGSTETGAVAHRQQLINNHWRALPNVKLTSNHNQCLNVQSNFFSDADFSLGDKVAFYDDEHFSLLGRVDRLAKIEGKRISLTELEISSKQLDIVEDAYFLTFDQNRQYTAAVISLTATGITMLRQKGKRHVNQLIQSRLLQQFDRIVIPRKFRYVESIPSNSQGKRTVTDIKQLFTTNTTSNIANEIS